MFKTLERLRNGEQVFIVCIRDSITEQNYHLHGHLNYVGQFAEKLINTFDRCSFVLNTGVSGDTTWGALKRLQRDVLRFKPDLVTVMFGINDSKFGTEKLPEFISNMESLIDAIGSSGSELLLLTQNAFMPDSCDEAHLRKTYPAFAAAIREVAAAKRIPLCDIHAKWVSRTSDNPDLHTRLMDDGLHPNEHGHLYMAQTLFEYLEKEAGVIEFNPGGLKV